MLNQFNNPVSSENSNLSSRSCRLAIGSANGVREVVGDRR
jgi:hypothetical protein